MKICKSEGCDNYCEGNTDQCASHNASYRKAEKLAKKDKPVYFLNRSTKPIDKTSKKQARNINQYSALKGPWIEDMPCQVCFNCYADQIHHKMGKIGFADQWARDNNIPLLIDKRFWLGVCMECHDKIERHPTWAREHEYSLPRSEAVKKLLE